MTRRSTLYVAFLASAMGLAGHAWADVPRFQQRDPACEHIATVQFRDCEVDVVYQCPAVDAETRPVFREEFFDAIGPVETGIGTRDGLLIELFYPGTDFLLSSDPAKRSSVSIETMIATGTGHISTAERITQGSVVTPVTTVIDMSDTGKSVQLGQAVARVFRSEQVSQYQSTTSKGVTATLAYLVPSLNLTLGGEMLSGPGFNPKKLPHRPMSIALPGAPDFVTTKPAFCGPNLS